jgi:hypothetical protein
MSNTITITNRGDSSQSIGETNKLIARIAVLEDRLTKLTDKSSKQADMMGKGYASAEAKVKHFEQALKSATSVTTKYKALEGLQAAVREFKVAKADFESSMQLGHNPGIVIDAVVESTKKLGAVRANEWSAEQSRQMSFAALQQDIISRSKEQLAIEQRLANERASTAQASKMSDHANAWNAEKSQLREAAALRQDIINRMTAQVAIEQQMTQSKAIESVKQLSAAQANAWNAEQMRLHESKLLRDDIISRLNAQVATERKLEQQKAVDITGRLGAWQQSPQRSTMSSQLFDWQQKEKQAADAARRQEMLDRDAGVRERQMRIARARELDAKYGSRSVAESFDASNRRGVGMFDSENALKDRRSLLQDRKAGLSPSSESYQKTIDELRQIEAMLKRINAKPMKAVELGSPKALQQQIKYLQAEMAKIGAGPQWDNLNAKLAAAKTQLGGMQQKSRDAEKALSQAATAPMGSWVRLEFELEQAKKELSLLTYGTKEFIAQQAKVAGLQKDWDNVNTAVNKTNKSQSEGSSLLTSLVGQAKSFALTYVGIHQTAQMITTEFNKHREFQLESAKYAAELNRELLKQAPNIDIENVPEVKQFAIANAERLLADPKDVAHLVGVAQSSSAKTLKGAIAGAEASLLMTLGDVAQSEELITGGLMIASLNNSENSKAALGQLRTTSKVSLATDEAQFIGNVLPAITGLSRSTKNVDGITTEQSLELVGAFSRIMGDREGSTTNTNLMSMRTSFDDFNPVRKKKLKDGKISILDQATIDAFNAERDLFARRQMMIDNHELGNQFLNLQKRGGPRNLAQAWLHPTASDQRFMKESQDAIPSFAAGERVFESVVKQARDQNPGLVARQGRSSATVAALSADRVALPGEARAGWDSIWNGDEKNKALNLTGLDWIARMEAGNAMGSQRRKRVDEGLPVNEGDTYRTGVEYLLKREQRMGGGSDTSLANIKVLEAMLRSMDAVKQGIDELNAQVAAGRQGPNAAPRRAAPGAQAPPVPRVPIAQGVQRGDPFGMRKR